MTVKKILSTVLLIGLLFTLVACGGGKKVVTVDDSADYQSARALPPLKKPSAVASNEAQPAAPSVAEPAIQARPLDQPAPAVEAPVVEQSPAAVAQEPEVAQVPQAEPAPAAAPQPVASSVSARVIKVDGQARLEINADFDQSWAYLSRNLKKSDVTIFSRNKAAGQFAIGCGVLETAPAVEKKGRWSFFNRAKQQQQEYCALQAVEKRGVTTVSVINRAGAEVSGEYSNDVFNRILNN